MKIPQAAIDLIKTFEGLRLEPYICPAGVLTVGVGHTGPDVHPGVKITEEQAEALLASDLLKFALGVSSALKVPVNDNQLSALISFAFNLGLSAFNKSTMLRKINLHLFKEVPAELLKWNHANGNVVPGLTRRRQAEAALWEKA